MGYIGTYYSSFPQNLFCGEPVPHFPKSSSSPPIHQAHTHRGGVHAGDHHPTLVYDSSN